MEFVYCRRCGAKVEDKGRGLFACADGHETYNSPASGTGLLLLNSKDQLLITVRGVEPDKGLLDVPGGFLDAGESYEEATEREVREELGVGPDAYTNMVYLLSGVNDYQYKGESKPVINVLFWARVKDDKLEFKPDDDVAEVYWVDLATFNPDDIKGGFTTLKKAIVALQKKIANA